MHLIYSNCLKKHYNDYSCKVLITSPITWLPFELLMSEVEEKISKNNPKAEFYRTSILGLNLKGNGSTPASRSKTRILIKILTNGNFYLYFLQCTFLVFLLKLKLTESRDFDKLRIRNIKIGDIVAAEYLRNPAKGDGNLKVDFRFYVLTIKYLIVFLNFDSSVGVLLKKYKPTDIRFSLQETSFKDEMLRRLMISKGMFFEYQFDKYQGKLLLFEYVPYCEGRVFEYTPKLNDITPAEIEECRSNLDKRIFEGIAVWTGNVTDIDSTFKLDEESHLMINHSKPTAILFLHAVADDQFRCGLDCFISIDDFHRYTIKTVLSLGYQCILKPHPGIKSALHPDKSEIDDRYVLRLFDDLGLDYRKTTDSCDKMIHRSLKISGLYAMNPKVSIKSIKDKFDFITLTHHGTITYEALHLQIPVLKYRYCKSREFDFTHSWEDRESYFKFLTYYAENRTLPVAEFKDSYLTVSAILSRKKKFNDYNKVFINSYKEYYPENNLIIPPNSAEDSKKNIELINNSYNNDEGYSSYLKNQLQMLIG